MRFRRRVASRLILQPSVHPIEAETLRRVEIPRDAGMLEAFVGYWPEQQPEGQPEARPGVAVKTTGEPPECLVLKLPGTAGRAERSTLFPASLLEGRRSEVWTWNAPGYGRSTGPACLSGIPAAVLEFYDHVVSRHAGSGTRIWISGNSLGCAVGLYLASRRPVDGVVFRNPPPLVELVAARDAWWNLGRGGRMISGWIPPEMDALQTAPRVRAPAVFLESTADTLVTPAMQEMVRAAHAGEHRVVRLVGAAHDTPLDERYYRAIAEQLRWLWEQPRVPQL